MSRSSFLLNGEQEATRGTAGALASQIRQADKSREGTEKRVVKLFDDWEAYEASRKGPGRPRDYEKLVDKAIVEYEEAGAAGGSETAAG